MSLLGLAISLFHFDSAPDARQMDARVGRQEDKVLATRMHRFARLQQRVAS